MCAGFFCRIISDAMDHRSGAPSAADLHRDPGSGRGRFTNPHE